jgi:uncharacterized low-complexity protein|tara:strand:+ start:13350 stop:13592 length:243 start_codon:yes stop_codon:yes gene_type:complete
MRMKKLNTAVLTLSATLLGAAGAVHATENPFAVQELQSGYSLADNHGAGDMEGKCGEGSCGDEEGKGDQEGKCGEGTCGS